jgi:hypothetical protein
LSAPLSSLTIKVSFSREITKEGKSEKVEDIKISRGEENIFVWSFFLAIAQLAIDYADKKGYHLLALQVYIFRHFSLKDICLIFLVD